MKSKFSLLQSPFSLSLNYVFFNQSLLSILIISIAENSVCTGEMWVSSFRFWQNLCSTLLEYGQSVDAALLSKNGKICVSTSPSNHTLPVMTPEQGMTFANFSCSGTFPFLKDWFIMCVMCGNNTSPLYLIIFGDTLSWPPDWLGFSLFISLMTSCSLVGYKKHVCWFGSSRYFCVL